MKITFNQNKTKPLFDTKYNILYKNTVSVTIDDVCVLSENSKTYLKALAWIILALLLASLFWLIIIFLSCRHRVSSIGALFKYWLAAWSKVQLVAFFLLLGVVFPCCVRAFLEPLFDVMVGWNRALGYRIDELNASEAGYVSARASPALGFNMLALNIAPFFLNNFGVAFIIHCCVFLGYLILKAWDFMQPRTQSKIYGVLNFWEFTLMVITFILVEFHVFVYASLNIRTANFSVAVAGISFFIAVLYILVFAFFIFYAVLSIYKSHVYLIDPIKYNQFYYFIAGYRDSAATRLYDPLLLLLHLIIGFTIGLG